MHLLKRELERAIGDGIDSVAIVFMHAYAYPEHERQAALLAREAGFSQISVSHEVSPLIRIVGRGDTTVADAYLSPVLKGYVDKVAAALSAPSPRLRHAESVPSARREGRGEGQQQSAAQASAPHPNPLPTVVGRGNDVPQLLFMASSGGLKSAQFFHGRDAILSGPAGGVVGMAETARAAGFERVIGFDMGGTSTDVAHFAGEYERRFETEVAGVRLRTPTLSIHTVAAGGGSILTFDGSRLRAGPESAGSDPGPLCYRRGGPLTITDANVMTGKLKGQFFPAVFGPGRDQPIDEEAVRQAFAALAAQIGDGRTPEAVADGFIRIAVENMANAIKKISVERGYDVTRYALNCFGSAGGQHACLIADTLGIETVLIHPLSGLLSAYGIGLASLRASREQSIEVLLDDAAMREIESRAWSLGNEVTEELLDQGVAHDDIAITSTLHLRYEGTDSALPVLLSEPDLMVRDFEAAHGQRFGFISPEKRVFAAHIEVEAAGGGEAQRQTTAQGSAPHPSPLPASGERELTARFYSRGTWHEGPVLLREGLAIGQRVAGPALIIEPHQTVVVEDGWAIGGHGTKRSRAFARRTAPAGSTRHEA